MWPQGANEGASLQRFSGLDSPHDSHSMFRKASSDMPVAMINQYGSGHIILDPKTPVHTMLSSGSFSPLFDDPPAPRRPHPPSPTRHPVIEDLDLASGFETTNDADEQVLVVDEGPDGNVAPHNRNAVAKTYSIPVRSRSGHGSSPRQSPLLPPSIPSSNGQPTSSDLQSTTQPNLGLLRRSPVHVGDGDDEVLGDSEPESLSDTESGFGSDVPVSRTRV